MKVNILLPNGAVLQGTLKDIYGRSRKVYSSDQEE
jgi:hypothetical protein